MTAGLYGPPQYERDLHNGVSSAVYRGPSYYGRALPSSPGHAVPLLSVSGTACGRARS